MVGGSRRGPKAEGKGRWKKKKRNEAKNGDVDEVSNTRPNGVKDGSGPSGSDASGNWREQKKSRGQKHQKRERLNYKSGGGKGGERKEKTRFQDFLSKNRAEDGVRDGSLVRGRIRINPRRREEAYVTVEGLQCDVILKGSEAQNRSIEGDLVAVKLLPLDQWDRLDGREDEKASDATEPAQGRGDVTSASSSTRGSDSETGSEDGGEEENAVGTRDVETLASFVEKKLTVGEDSAVAAGSSFALEDVNALFREQGRRPAGEVVAILRPSPQRDHVVCSLMPAGTAAPRKVSNFKFAGFVLRPLDERFPLLLLDERPSKKSLLCGNPEELCEELERARESFVLCKITRWPTWCSRPYCEVTEVLGEMQQKESQLAAILKQQGIEQTHGSDFSETVLACLPETPWQVGEDELAKRKDLREWRIFSIDPETARDLDDALSVELLPEGDAARIGVHIADVTHFVRAGTPLDEEAASRATSVYMVDGVLPMLPRLLCEQLCSLQPGADRLAFSVVWEIDLATCEIRDEWIGKSVIRSCTKLHYGQAQEIIEGKELTSEPVIHGHALDDVAADVVALDSLAKRLRARRFEAGALTLNIPRISIVLGEDGNPKGAKPYVQGDSNYLVEEFMLLANRRVARFLADRIPSAAVLRRHPPPHSRKIDHLSKMAKKMGLEIDVSGSKAIHDSLERLRSEIDPGTFYAVVLLATKPMQNAVYFCTGAPEFENRQDRWGHYALAFAHYTHFTSPIRRYADVLVHRLLMDVLTKAKGSPAEKKAKAKGGGGAKGVLFESTGSKRSPWGRKFTEALADQLEQCNKQKLAAKSVQDASTQLYLALWLAENPYETRAVILDLNGPKWMGVFAPEFGVEFKVHWADDKAVKASWDAASGTMEVRSRGKGGEAVKLKNFETVTVVLESSFNRKACANEIRARLKIGA